MNKNKNKLNKENSELKKLVRELFDVYLDMILEFEYECNNYYLFEKYYQKLLSLGNKYNDFI